MNRRIALSLAAAALAALTLQPVAALADPPPHARNDKHVARHDDRRDDRYDDRWRHDDRWQHDEHWRHDRPRYGYVVHRLPPHARLIHYRGDRYYYGGGTWYRPYGPRYAVIAPPVGLVVSFLPDFHAVMHFGGVPYYQAGPVYYVWKPKARGYVVTDGPYRYW